MKAVGATALLLLLAGPSDASVGSYLITPAGEQERAFDTAAECQAYKFNHWREAMDAAVKDKQHGGEYVHEYVRRAETLDRSQCLASDDPCLPALRKEGRP
jgi:hypothetical protein